MLDGTTKSSDSFSGPIGKCLNGDISSWTVAVNFKLISNPHIVKLPESVVDDFSADNPALCLQDLFHYNWRNCRQ